MIKTAKCVNGQRIKFHTVYSSYRKIIQFKTSWPASKLALKQCGGCYRALTYIHVDERERMHVNLYIYCMSIYSKVSIVKYLCLSFAWTKLVTKDVHTYSMSVFIIAGSGVNAGPDSVPTQVPVSLDMERAGGSAVNPAVFLSSSGPVPQASYYEQAVQVGVNDPMLVPRETLAPSVPLAPLREQGMS